MARRTIPDSRSDLFAIFSEEHYAGFWLRVLIAIVDGAVAAVVSLFAFGVAAFLLSLLNPPFILILIPLFVALVVSYLYLVVLKRSPVKTVGYRLARCEVIAVSGEFPSLRAMTVRYLLWFIINPFYNLLSISNERSRQAVSDQVAGTLVVRSGARPITKVRSCIQHLFFLGYTFIVKSPKILRFKGSGK